MASKGLELHPICDLLPPMQPEEFKTLKADIARNGVREPVVLYDGKVIDGRHRLRACKELGIEAPTRTWEGPGEPDALSLSLNLARRHLSASQRAALAVRLLASKSAVLHSGGGGDRTTVAARVVGCSRRSVFRAKKLSGEESKDIFDAVLDGDVSLDVAERLMCRRETDRPGLLQRLRDGEPVIDVLGQSDPISVRVVSSSEAREPSRPQIEWPSRLGSGVAGRNAPSAFREGAVFVVKHPTASESGGARQDGADPEANSDKYRPPIKTRRTTDVRSDPDQDTEMLRHVKRAFLCLSAAERRGFDQWRGGVTP